MTLQTNLFILLSYLAAGFFDFLIIPLLDLRKVGSKDLPGLRCRLVSRFATSFLVSLLTKSAAEREGKREGEKELRGKREHISKAINNNSFPSNLSKSPSLHLILMYS